MRRVLPPGYDWRLAGYPMCGIGGRCYQMGDAADIGVTTFDSKTFWRAVGVGVGVTLAVRLIDRLLLSRFF